MQDDGHPISPHDAARLLLEIIALAHPEAVDAIARQLSAWNNGANFTYERLVACIRESTGEPHDPRAFRVKPKKRSLAATLGDGAA